MKHEHIEYLEEQTIDPHGQITVTTWTTDTLRKHIKRWPTLETE